MLCLTPGYQLSSQGNTYSIKINRVIFIEFNQHYMLVLQQLEIIFRDYLFLYLKMQKLKPLIQADRCDYKITLGSGNSVSLFLDKLVTALKY